LGYQGKAKGSDSASLHFYGQTTATLCTPSLSPYLQALEQLPAADQQMVLNLIRGLAERNRVTIAHTAAPELQTLEEGIPLWLASLKAEQYSPRTINDYHLIVKNYLKYDPQPVFLNIQR
jgi:hypothetical protein